MAYALTLLKTALRAAVAEDLIKRNPAEFVKPPPQPSREMQTWTADELRTFLEHGADDDLAGAWHLTALGLRRGEVLALRWADVDLEQAVSSVSADPACRRPAKGRSSSSSPKPSEDVGTCRSIRQRSPRFGRRASEPFSTPL